MSESFRVAFWNLHGTQQAFGLAMELCQARKVDLFIAAELPGHTPGLSRSPTARLGYASFRPGLEVTEVDAYAHAVALRVRLAPASRDLSVIGVHLPSRLYLHHEEDQRLAADTCRGFVENHEGPRSQGGVAHDRSLVLGDFNLDPYSPAMVGFAGFNALMTRPPRRLRRFGKQDRPTFWNPMWNEFGDLSGSPGTYYLRNPGALGYYWHMLDQVLIRPSLVAHFEAVSILDDDAFVSPRARTPKREVSDHLPIELQLSARAFDLEETT